MKKYLKILFCASMFLASTSIFAEEDENPDAPPGDPGMAPIDEYIPVLLIGATILAYRFLPKGQQMRSRSKE